LVFIGVFEKSKLRGFVGALPPHPCPLPPGEGERPTAVIANERVRPDEDERTASLSLGERAGVREKGSVRL
jgi:hypothetical protein